jgi:hypothetical protein
MEEKYNKDVLDNRSRQLNSKDELYYKARGINPPLSSEINNIISENEKKRKLKDALTDFLLDNPYYYNDL